MARFRIKDLSKDPVLLASDFRCAYCGRDLLGTLEAFVSFSRDHVRPKSRGGSDGTTNRVATCAACERLKADARVRTVEEARREVAHRRKQIARAYLKLRAAFRTA